MEDDEKDSAILDAIKRIEKDTQVVSVPERTKVWQDGWNENLQEFISSGYDLNALIPKYFHENVTLRLKQKFIKSDNSKFENNFENVFRAWLFKKYFAPYDTICEFGCGTGLNLIILAKMYPNKKIFGLDFVQSSVDIANLLHEKWSTEILTFASIEQSGDQYEDFVNYLLENQPALCVHVEPMAELYDKNVLTDYLAYRFHTNRNYPKGFIDLLHKLETDGYIEILKIKRCYFGGWNHETFNMLIWKPTGKFKR